MSLHIVLMRYDVWPSHQSNEHKSSNQHIKQEHNKYIIKGSTKSLEVTSNAK